MRQPSHALLISGTSGSGKASVAQYITAGMLGLSSDTPDAIAKHQYIRIIRPIDNKAIPIETVRSLQHFLHLTIPGKVVQSFSRAVIIEDAQFLTIEAQNSLLKTLEEPPRDTVIIMTASSIDSLLPTIQSRVRELAVLPPAADTLTEYFSSHGHKSSDIQRAMMLSGELPGLTAALLAEDTAHPLVVATTHARGILQSKTYQRLLLVDGLSKQRQLCLDILYVLGQMSRTAIRRTSDPKAIQRWRTVMQATYDATEQLQYNTQTKLVLTNLMLKL
ncbi:MAG TPA: hypothetical protein VF575_01730 [Candidatus Saccharimonadales bacterium]|jgi:DNA polymerase III delta prime subunit